MSIAAYNQDHSPLILTGLVDRNPLRRCLKRVVSAVSQSMYPLPNSLMRAFNAERVKNLFCFSQ